MSLGTMEASYLELSQTSPYSSFPFAGSDLSLFHNKTVILRIQVYKISRVLCCFGKLLNLRKSVKTSDL